MSCPPMRLKASPSPAPAGIVRIPASLTRYPRTRGCSTGRASFRLPISRTGGNRPTACVTLILFAAATIVGTTVGIVQHVETAMSSGPSGPAGREPALRIPRSGCTTPAVRCSQRAPRQPRTHGDVPRQGGQSTDSFPVRTGIDRPDTLLQNHPATPPPRTRGSTLTTARAAHLCPHKRGSTDLACFASAPPRTSGARPETDNPDNSRGHPMLPRRRDGEGRAEPPAPETAGRDPSDSPHGLDAGSEPAGGNAGARTTRRRVRSRRPA